MKYDAPRHVDEGMPVIAPMRHEGRIVGVRCVVVTAAGDLARVRNEQRGYDRWQRISDLRVEVPAPCPTCDGTATVELGQHRGHPLTGGGGTPREAPCPECRAEERARFDAR